MSAPSISWNCRSRATKKMFVFGVNIKNAVRQQDGSSVVIDVPENAATIRVGVNVKNNHDYKQDNNGNRNPYSFLPHQ
jgi:hypothetical protein